MGEQRRTEKKSVLRQVDRRDVHWRHGLGGLNGMWREVSCRALMD